MARTAGQLEPQELGDFQVAARALITNGLVTDRHPRAGVLALVRVYEEPLRYELDRLCHWRLDLGPASARLLRRPVAVSRHRPARTASTSQRPFNPRTYASLCLVLAALERLGDQTTVSRLADEVVRLRSGDDEAPVDLTVHAHRRALVDAVAWLQQLGVLRLVDGETERYLSGAGDALYDVDRDAAGRLLVSPPTLVSALRGIDDFLDEPYAPTPEGAQARARHRVHRRLLTEPALYYAELPTDERDYARQRRTRIRHELERLTGATLECRAEGQSMVGLDAAHPFPAGGAVAQAALLLGSELAIEVGGEPSGQRAGGDHQHAVATEEPDDALFTITAEPELSTAVLVASAHAEPVVEPHAEADHRQPVGRVVSGEAVLAAWRRVVASYANRFTADYREDPDRLRVDATAFLVRLDLVAPWPRPADGGLVVRPALARYRADLRLPETLDG